MKKNYKNLFLAGGIFLIGVVCSLFLPAQSHPLIVENEILITFVGVVVGVSATIITFIFSSMDKIWRVIGRIYTAPDQFADIEKQFKSSYNELIDDTTLIFGVFILLIICVLVDIFTWKEAALIQWLPKEPILNAVKMGLFFNCLIAVCDLFFSLINMLKLVLYEIPTHKTQG